jgi:hypothetical protein
VEGDLVQSQGVSNGHGEWLPVVNELPTFARKWGQYCLTEFDRTTMLEAILGQPERWPVIKGASGARKARFSTHDLDCGSSGGYRVFYVVFRNHGKIVLITMFPKSERANLSNAGLAAVARLVREIEAELELIDREDATRN